MSDLTPRTDLSTAKARSLVANAHKGDDAELIQLRKANLACSVLDAKIREQLRAADLHPVHQPIFQSMSRMAASGAPVPMATLADLDKGALNLARSYAADHGLGDRTQTVRVNVLDRRGFSRLAGSLPGFRPRSGWIDAFDAVDAVGLLEYLKAEDWIYVYKGVITTRRKQAGAVTFVRNAFQCVRPGGLLIVGNMLDTHPQLAFTMDVVQWPHIQPRSIEEVLSIFGSAGVTGHIDVYLPSDGVYAIYAIRKDG